MATGAFSVNVQGVEHPADEASQPYFVSGWNQLDFFVVITTYVSYFLEDPQKLAWNPPLNEQPKPFWCILRPGIQYV